MSRNLNAQNTELNKMQENNYHFNNQFDIVDRNTRPKTNYSTPIRQKLPPGKENININGPLKNETDPEKQLLYYFNKKKIYIEIYNDNINASEIFYDILLKYKITQSKKLHKKLDYIIFKDGHLKTQRYAVLNNIKMVNPLWIDDKVNHHIFKNDEEYLIKTNFGDILIKERYNKNQKDEKKQSEKPLNEIQNNEPELELEFDTEYANLIDKKREEEKNKNENLSKKFEIGRAPRKTEEEKKIDDVKVSVSKKINLVDGNMDNDKNYKNKKDNQSKINTNNGKKIKSVDKIVKKNIPKSKDNKKSQKSKIKKNTKRQAFFSNQNKNISEKTLFNTSKDYSSTETNSINDSFSTLQTSNVEKINLMTYKLSKNEISCLENLEKFDYKGDLKDLKDKIYESSIIIILDKNSCKYDYKFFQFLIDKKICIDFTSFLLEFIDIDLNKTDLKIEEKINQISINNDLYFCNKKLRYQKKSLLNVINICDNIATKERKIVEKKYEIEFFINEAICEEEKKVIYKLLKSYLKANIINYNNKKNNNSESSNKNKRASSVENTSIKNKLTNCNLEVINENVEEENNEKQKIIVDENKKEEIKSKIVYIISKDNVGNLSAFIENSKIKGAISVNYVYDSFLNGELFDLSEEKIYQKYLL